MTIGKEVDSGLVEASSTAEMAQALRASGAVDDLLAQIDTGEVALTGEGGLLPGLIKLALERGLAAELTDHLGYEKGDPAGRALPNARNGASPKTVQSEAGPVGLDVPRDRDGSFTPRLVPKGQRRIGGLDDMIISLYAGGMTLRDIQFHLVSTIGTEVSHETISKIVDEISDEVLAWQRRPLEPRQSLAVVANLGQEMSDATWRTEPPTNAGQGVLLRADSNGHTRCESRPPGGRVDELWFAVVYRCWQREHHRDAPNQFPLHQPRRSDRDR